MKKLLLIILLFTLLLPNATHAALTPVSVMRDTVGSFIRPLNMLDYIKSPFFVATSTTGTSTFAGKVAIGTTTIPAGYTGHVQGETRFTASDNSSYTNFNVSSQAFSSVYGLKLFTGPTASVSASIQDFVTGHGVTIGTADYGLHVTGPTYLASTTVEGMFHLQSGLRDITNATGTLGMVLTSTGTSTRWIATSSLGISGGSGTPGGTSGQVQFNDSSTFGGGSILYWDKTNSRLGIGTSTPIYTQSVVGTSSLYGNLFINPNLRTPQLNAFGSELHPVQFSFNTNDIVGQTITNMNSGVAAGTILNFSNDRTTLGTLGLLQRYQANIVYSGSGYNGCAVGTCSLRPNSFAAFVTDGDYTIGVSTSTLSAAINFQIGSTTFNDWAPDMRLDYLGNLSLGWATTTAPARFAVRGRFGSNDVLMDIASSSSAVYSTATAVSVLKVLSNGRVSVGSSTPNAKFTVVGTAGTLDILNIASSTNASVLMVKSTGFVGVGTSSPSHLFTVAGDINLTGALRFNGLPGTSGQILKSTGTSANWVNNTKTLVFTYASSTWSGTTTIALGPAFNAQTFSTAKCFTDTGTLGSNLTDGTNVMNPVEISTTVGAGTTLSTNNTYTAGEKRYINIGSPASSPTVVSCSIEFYE